MFDVVLPWIEKFRPPSVQHVILPKGLNKMFGDMVAAKTIHKNMLFYSVSPGTGKSSAAKALCRDVGLEYIYVNTSLNRSIDTLRDTIYDFVTTLGMDGGLKIVILDEFDGAGDILQKALKAFMEEYVDTCRFILTCNNIAKIDDAIVSRCDVVDFNYANEKQYLAPKFVERVELILKSEGISCTDPEIIAAVVDAKYPDLRSVIKTMQSYYDMFGVINSDIIRYAEIEDEIWELVYKKRLNDAVRKIVDRGFNIDQVYRGLHTKFLKLIQNSESKSKIILVAAQYADMHTRTIDKELTLKACLIEISNCF